MKGLLSVLFVILCQYRVFAQQTTFEGAETVYSTEMAGGITIHSNSWGVNFYTAKYLTGFTKLQYHFELVGMKSQRQYRIPVDNGGYYYGKLNSVLILRTSVGYMKEFLPRQSQKGISVSYILNAGLSSAFVKPVYLQIMLENNNVVDERYNPELHNTNNIKGRSMPFIGIDEMQYHPGLFLRTALGFDYGPRTSLVRGLEVGLAADIFAQPVSIMAYEEPNQYFATAFFSLVFGSRKYHGENKDSQIEFEE